jgi:hypothetical protein
MNGAYNFNLYIKVFKLLVLFALAPVVCEVLVAQYIVFCVEFCLLSFEHCIVSPSSAFSFWLPFSIFKLFYSTKMEEKENIHKCKDSVKENFHKKFFIHQCTGDI